MDGCRCIVALVAGLGGEGALEEYDASLEKDCLNRKAG
jgi:hypothetical protein